MLKVRDLVVAYGGIEALKGISIDVPEGQRQRGREEHPAAHHYGTGETPERFCGIQ